jgi:hypothetical protein
MKSSHAQFVAPAARPKARADIQFRVLLQDAANRGDTHVQAGSREDLGEHDLTQPGKEGLELSHDQPDVFGKPVYRRIELEHGIGASSPNPLLPSRDRGASDEEDPGRLR